MIFFFFFYLPERLILVDSFLHVPFRAVVFHLLLPLSHYFTCCGHYRASLTVLYNSKTGILPYAILKQKPVFYNQLLKNNKFIYSLNMDDYELSAREKRCLSQVAERFVCCRSATVRLLGSRVRIPQEDYTSVSCELCVLSGRSLRTDRSLVQRSPTDCAVSECDLKASTRETLAH